MLFSSVANQSIRTMADCQQQKGESASNEDKEELGQSCQTRVPSYPGKHCRRSRCHRRHAGGSAAAVIVMIGTMEVGSAAAPVAVRRALAPNPRGAARQVV